MSQILSDSGSNKKWMAGFGVVMAVVAAVWWVRRPQGSDRVQDALSAASVQAAVTQQDAPAANLPPDPALVAQQAEAAKVIEAQPDMQPVAGPVKERPAYVSTMEWTMLQGVAQQQADPDKELTRMVNFLRFSKQWELWESLPKTPETAAKRQALATQLVNDLPTRVANGEFDMKDAQGKLTLVMGDAVIDPAIRRQREEIESKRLLAANETYKTAEKTSKQ